MAPRPGDHRRIHGVQQGPTRQNQACCAALAGTCRALWGVGACIKHNTSRYRPGNMFAWPMCTRRHPRIRDGVPVPLGDQPASKGGLASRVYIKPTDRGLQNRIMREKYLPFFLNNPSSGQRTSCSGTDCMPLYAKTWAFPWVVLVRASVYRRPTVGPAKGSLSKMIIGAPRTQWWKRPCVSTNSST